MGNEEIKIHVSKKGPYIVKGAVTVIDSNGIEIVSEKMIALCRCGGSNNKPHCDGTHTNIGFKG
jgi:CDGSH-type Zn-finger protein